MICWNGIECGEDNSECFCEPRTTVDIMRDLLEVVQEKEFTTEQVRCSRSCCYDWWTSCSECSAREEGYKEPEKHDDDCKLAALIKEAEGFIKVEEDILDEQEVAS